MPGDEPGEPSGIDAEEWCYEWIGLGIRKSQNGKRSREQLVLVQIEKEHHGANNAI